MSSIYIPVVQHEPNWAREQEEAGTGQWRRPLHLQFAQHSILTCCTTLTCREQMVDSSGGGGERTHDIGGQRTFLFSTTPGLS